MRLRLLFLLTSFAFLASCSSSGSDEPSPNNSSSSHSNGGNNGSSAIIQCTALPDELSKDQDDLGLSNAIVIRYNKGSAPYIYNPYAEVQTEVTGENVVVKVASTTVTAYNFVVSGTATNGSLKMYGEFRTVLYLNGVSIANTSGPAINSQINNRMTVHLVAGTENFLADGTGYDKGESATEQAKGTFFSEGALIFEGSGYLGVRGRNNHAIVSDGRLTVESGCIAVTESENDGIHANNDITINGGIVNITSKGDAIQSERLAVIVSGGQVIAKTTGIKSHGIASGDSTAVNSPANGRTTIKDNARIDITVDGNGSKGIKSSGFTEIMGGTINIQVNGSQHIQTSPRDTSGAAGIKLDSDLFIEGGNLTIKSLGNTAKGINVDGSFFMTGGNIDIDADDDGIKMKGDLRVTGGSGTVRSRKTTALDCATGKTCNKGSLQTQDGGF